MKQHQGGEVTSTHNSVGSFFQEARKKGKPIIANPKARIGDKAKKRR